MPGLILGGGARITLDGLSLETERLLQALPVPTSELFSGFEPSSALALEELEVLSHNDLIEEVLSDAEGRALVVVKRPLLARQRHLRGPLHPHLYCRRSDSGWMILSPTTRAYTWVDSEFPDVLHELEKSDATTDESLIAVLMDNGFTALGGAKWAFHDGLFHSVSSFGGGTDQGYGAKPLLAASGTSRARRQLKATVADQLASVSLRKALLERRSTRAFSRSQIPDRLLRQLLSSSLGAMAERSDMAATRFPYPSGGGRNEVSTLVAQCGPDMEPCVHEYDNEEDALFGTDVVPRIAEDIVTAMGAICQCSPNTPRTVLLFAANYERLASRYDAIAYATLLRNIGAIYQTIYLVAAGLGLGCCAAGGGWSECEKGLRTTLGERVLVGAVVLGFPEDG